jgi:predicted nucleic acid-binding protein
MSKPKRLVVDTSVAIYLVTFEPPKGQEDEWRAARDLSRIDPDEWVLCLPAPALGEVLAGVPLKRQDDTAEILCRMFEVLDYDKDAALVAGRIALTGIRGRSKTSKQAVKIDVEM